MAAIAYVWIWLPGATEPVVAGRLDDAGPNVTFTYGSAYLARPDAIALYEPELPLRRGRQLPELLGIHGCIADAGPDAWGRRVINRRTGTAQSVDLTGLAYLLASGSERVGALDFQMSADSYAPREQEAASLDDLVQAAEAVDQGIPLAPALELALFHGTSIGGAQPKALLRTEDRHLIAKFSSRTDTLPTVKAEYVAMTLARRVGLDVATVEITNALGRDVLLVERFDRPAGGLRRSMVSARTILRLGEMGIGASYAELADEVRQRFTQPEATLRELFSRVVFNILIGNTDDHARNHAAFWDGAQLTLTPAYDLVPQRRAGEVAAQAMAIGRDGVRASQLVVCVRWAAIYKLSEAAARAIIDDQVSIIKQQWDAVCDEADLDGASRAELWGRQFLHPYAFADY